MAELENKVPSDANGGNTNIVLEMPRGCEVLSDVNGRNTNIVVEKMMGCVDNSEYKNYWPRTDSSRIDVPDLIKRISDIVLDDYSTLQKTPFYIDIMLKIEDALANHENIVAAGEEVDKDRSLVGGASILAIEAAKEIYSLYHFIRHCYQLRSLELSSSIHSPMDYIQVVKKIGNETNLPSVDLEGLLPEDELLDLYLATFSSFAKPLPEHILNKTIEACDRAIALDLALNKIFQFIKIVRGPDSAARCERNLAGGLRRVTPENTQASAPPPPPIVDRKTIIKNMSFAAKQRAYVTIRRSREARQH